MNYKKVIDFSTNVLKKNEEEHLLKFTQLDEKVDDYYERYQKDINRIDEV